MVKDFWIRPIELSVQARKFSFGYVDEKGKKKRYKAEVKGEDLESFHDFVFKIMAAKKKNQLPWPFVTKVKDKVKITNLDDTEEQMEMDLRVARRYYEKCRDSLL